jgi:hypothetical protein
MSGFYNNALIGAGRSGYQIERSLRFNSADTAYLSRTPASAGNLTTWTFSCWFKRGSLSNSNNQTLLWASGGSAEDGIRIVGTSGAPDTDKINFYIYNGGYVAGQFATTQLFRDHSAWYHLIWVWDTTNATSTDRIRLYINGERVTSFSSSTYPSLNAQSGAINRAYQHEIGRQTNSTARVFDGYLTEVNFIDGQALTPSSFGETNLVTGVWGPKKYAGTYGTNGFYLKFADNSGTTSTTLGKDSSGNGNNWTPNNFSVTAGAGNDSMIDTPTPYADGGNGRGNYCTLNPTNRNNGGTAPTMVNGNLETTSAVNATHIWGTMAVPSSTNSWYWEGVCTSMDTNRTYIGIIDSVTTGSSPGASYGFIDKAILSNNGNYFNLASGTGGGNSGSYTSYAQNDVVMVAYSNGKIWFGKNGTWMNSGNPAAGTGAIDTGVSTSKTWLPYFGYNSNWTANFGQRAFAYTPPTGFLALNTQNLPEPSIKNSLTAFDATTWTGTGASLAVNVTGKFQPDLVWIKGRSGATGHRLTDSVRGVTNALSSNSPSSNTIVDTQGVTAFNSGGFTVGSNATYNTSSATYIAWQWKRGASQGFDISSTFTGTGSAQTVTHSLGVAPSMIILFSTGGTNWINTRVYHTRLSAGNALQLSTTAAQFSDPTTFASVNSSSFQTTQTSGQINVAYLWSEVAGFSKFGSYTGNGSSDGPFVHCGFRPRYIFLKRTDSTADWYTYDAARNTYNGLTLELDLNSSIAETGAGGITVDFVSNGFKIRRTGNAVNASGGTYIFAAFAESPFKYSLAR